MSAVKKLIASTEKHNSLICLGLDLDPKRMPSGSVESTAGMAQFAMRIIQATADVVAAYKPNMAFFETLGPEGLSLLRLVRSRIPEDTVVIMDGKRGDIGNSSEFYAKAQFVTCGADWVTVSPYMGYDSVQPFLNYEDKGAFVLCLTSNPGARDFQGMEIAGKPLYLHVAEKVNSWNKDGNCGLVVGATYPEQLIQIRQLAGEMPILIPGVGAQGGDLESAVLGGTANFTRPAIINVSRSVLYASNGEDYDKAARAVVEKLNAEINGLRNRPTS